MNLVTQPNNNLISKMEIINLQPSDISPYIKKCYVKVMYTGENDNGTAFSKEVTERMAKTLRGSPVVGYINDKTQDFGGHGEEVTIKDNGEIEFNILTRPYGFVPLEAKVWFQEFQETDREGVLQNRNYLMTEAYLWAGQYAECEDIIANGKGQSMEVADTQGVRTDDGLYIVHDANFFNLCILGDDVEPCFEGAKIATSFSQQPKEYQISYKTDSGMQITYSFNTKWGEIVKDLKNKDFAKEEEKEKEDKQEQKEANAETKEETNDKKAEKEDKEDFAKETSEKTGSDNEDETEDEKDKKFAMQENLISELTAKLETKNNELTESQEKFKKQTVSFDELTKKYEKLVEENKKLTEYFNKHEEGRKKELLDRFSKLFNVDSNSNFSLEDEEFAKLSYEELKAKLSLSYCDLVLDSDNTEKTTYTYNIESDTNKENVPSWFKRAMEIQKNI